MIELEIKTPKQFVHEVDKIVKEKNISYLDACMYYAQKANVEIEIIASLIKGSQLLKSKVQFDAEQLRLVKPTAKLPV